MSIKIIIADDHKLLRDGLSALLGKQTGLTVVGQASNGREAVQLAERVEAHVVVMDVSMPDLNGIDATRQILARQRSIKVIGLSMHCDRQFVAEMYRAGAAGYLLKDMAFEQLASAIRTAVKGHEFIVAKSIGFSAEEYGRKKTSGSVPSRLTDREREVLQSIAEGKATKEIAADLHLSAKTVETHRQHLMEKLEIYSVAELTKFAIREGLTTLDRRTPRRLG